MQPHYNPSLKQKARNLRNNMTRAENKLWYEYLRSHTPKVHRQRSIGTYITDFYIPKVRLIIEIDGDSHMNIEAQQYDKERMQYFISLGMYTLRFSNTEVFQNFEQVCMKIHQYVISHNI
jgi:very-short-patch-repair endonuclease